VEIQAGKWIDSLKTDKQTERQNEKETDILVPIIPYVSV
jgi:hypothetical protein